MASEIVTASIVRLDGPASWEACGPEADRILEGRPVHRAANAFTDASGQFFCGRWSSTPGKWRVRYTENELCVITAGRVTLESAAGESQSFAAGDAFVVPAGFEGTWTVHEDCTKLYAIFEQRV
ncbi:MAG TPA: cupin domain-containing protein [Steroidobacteraceae bacterium]|nr:cupin domain-containing protein [Steroidobacteraceae bacterium]